MQDDQPTTEAIDLTEVDEIIASIGQRQQDLIPILSAIQAHFNYLPEVALRRIPEQTEISAASVAGVATFYAQFRHRPAGRHAVKVCIGTACHVKGAEGIYDAFRQHLGIADSDDTDADKLFTIEKVACLGCCMLAPAVQIDDITYGFVEPGKVGNLLADFLEAQRQTQQDAEHAQTAEDVLGEARICLCSSCVAGGSLKTHAALADTIRRFSLPVSLNTVGCSGVSFQTPLIEIVMSDGRRFLYGMVQPDAVEAIMRRHFTPSRVPARAKAAINRLLDRLVPDSHDTITRYALDLRSGPDACYTNSQKRIVTEYAGEMNPSAIEDYRAKDGFKALEHCLQNLKPAAIIDTIIASGLRGRGGAGFPTGRKWQHVHAATEPVRYLICNGDEGDPGAFMDRMILESFPFRVLEGMIIAAYAIGANRGYLYIRNEYPLAAQRLREAIKQCEVHGLLGERILGADFDLHLEVVEGAGAFVCGEESALIQAIEGHRGMPRFRPPYPAECGLFEKPTLVNNVETYGMIPWIMEHGAADFATLGTDSSKGTKAFALAGKIARGGLIEVPMGMPLRQIVEEIGGGVPDGNAFKAVQIGGPSGGCVPAHLADAPVDYEALISAGAIMGSGGMVVLDQDDCMVAIAHYFLAFTQRESCGKCTYCRIGTKRMLEILERLCTGKARPDDLEQLKHLAEVTQEGSLCGLGRTAPNPVLSTLTHFRDEYEAHLDGRCPALQCKALIRYRITDSCIGCTRCAQACGVDAIQSVPHERHVIDETLCIRCDACRLACPVEGSVVVETGGRKSESGHQKVGSRMINVTINGEKREVADGTRVLGACHEVGIDVPTLCWLEGQSHFTSCMICVVKDVNLGRLIPACSAPVTDGMVIETDTDEVHEARRVALELLLSEHIGDCRAPCQRVCPLQLNIPLMIRQIAAGDTQSATATIRQAQTETGICCDQCDKRCEKACRRGRADEPVAIRRLIEAVNGGQWTVNSEEHPKPEQARLQTADCRPQTLESPTDNNLKPVAARFDSRMGPLQEGELDEFLAGADKGPQVLPTNNTYTPEEAAQESARCLRCDCRKPESCKLRQLTETYGARQTRYKGTERNPIEINREHPAIIFEPGKCIKCGICTRIANSDNDGSGLTFLHRGMETTIGVPFGDGLDSALTRDTALRCADACPTAALARREANDLH